MRTRLLLLPLAAALLGACSDQGPSLGGLGREIAHNRALWMAHAPSSYVYEVRHSCFCGVEGLGPVRVRVVAGSVVERSYVASGEAVSAALADLFPSVDGLFDVLEDAVAREAALVRVDWDPELGLPLDFFIDYSANTADEEEGYTIVDPPRTTP